MNVLSRVTAKTLWKNKTRTIVTIIGVILSVAMITAVTTFISSLIGLMVRSVSMEDGSWHMALTDVPYTKAGGVTANDQLNSSTLLHGLGYAPLEGGHNPDKPYLYVQEVGDAGFDTLLAIHLVDGRLPETNREVLIPQHLKTNGGVQLKIGDTLTLPLGERCTADGYIFGQSTPYYPDETPETLTVRETRTFTIVGVCERPSLEPRTAPGYTLITRLDPAALAPADMVSVYMTMTRPSNRIYDLGKVLAEEAGVGEDNLSYHTIMLSYMGISANHSFLATLYSMAGILIALIVVGSISLIYNAFAISVSERSKQFGMLSGVGATSRQIRHSVFFEALLISLLGIPLGILAGVGGIGVTIFLLRDAFNSFMNGGVEFTLDVSATAVLIAAAVGAVTVLISAYIPARRASRVSAIDAIRQTGDVRLRARQVKTSRISRRLFGIEGDLALKNFKRNRRRYRTTVFSLFISIVLFVSASAFAGTLGEGVTSVYRDSNYDLFVYNAGNEAEASLRREIAGLPGVKDVSGLQQTILYTNVDRETILAKRLDDSIPIENGKARLAVTVIGVDEETFDRFAATIDADPAAFRNAAAPRALVIDSQFYEKKGRRIESSLFSRVPSSLTIQNDVDEGEESASISVALQALTVENVWELPTGVEDYSPFANGVQILMPQSVYTALFASFPGQNRAAFVACDNAEAIETAIREILNRDALTMNIFNLTSQITQTRNTLLIINVFSYGFIVLMALISVANVFNTISTNVHLRRREFAMLKSVGMTKGGFNRMINYECIFYGLKALLYGLPVSAVVALLIVQAMSNGIDTAFTFPWMSMGIAVVSVFVVVFATMMYAMSKVRKETIIDALKNENL